MKESTVVGQVQGNPMIVNEPQSLCSSAKLDEMQRFAKFPHFASRFFRGTERCAIPVASHPAVIFGVPPVEH